MQWRGNAVNFSKQFQRFILILCCFSDNCPFKDYIALNLKNNKQFI